MSTRMQRSQFEKSVYPHVDSLYGSAYRLTRNAGDAEDLVQDALLRAYRFWGSFQEGSNCKAWLFKILTNTFFNTFKRKKRSREILKAATIEQESTDGILIHAQALNQRSPLDLLSAETLSEEVESALAKLPADFRIAIVLCDVEEFSYKEIAEILDCPVGTVMSRLHRGRRLLHKELLDFAEQRGLLSQDKKRSQPQLTPDNTIDLALYKQEQALAQGQKK